LQEKTIILIFILIYTLLFFAFYPKFFHYPDEQQYLRNAYLLKQGRLFVEDPLYAYGYLEAPIGFISFYPIGHSLFLLPFTFIEWNFVFIAGFLLHLASFYMFIKILKKLDLPVIFSLLY